MDSQFFAQIPMSEDFDAITGTIGGTTFTQSLFVHLGTIIEAIQRLDIDGDIGRTKADVVKSAFGDAANQRHLAAFKAGADGTARTRALALAAATAGFTVTTAFTATKKLGPMLGPRKGFQIVQTHNLGSNWSSFFRAQGHAAAFVNVFPQA